MSIDPAAARSLLNYSIAKYGNHLGGQGGGQPNSGGSGNKLGLGTRVAQLELFARPTIVMPEDFVPRPGMTPLDDLPAGKSAPGSGEDFPRAAGKDDSAGTPYTYYNRPTIRQRAQMTSKEITSVRKAEVAAAMTRTVSRPVEPAASGRE
jgi:hypothetical protein